MKNRLAALLSATLFCQLLVAKEPAPTGQLGDLEQVIVVAAREEAQANHIDKRKDVCLSFDTRLLVDQKAVLAELRRRRVMMHADNWCNRGPRGFTIFIAAPITESSPGTYEFVVDVGDATPITQGEDLATLVRRGKYTIQTHSAFTPNILSYQQTCCPENTK